MANALTEEAPLTKEVLSKFPKEDAALAQTFDPKKKYLFESANKNPLRDYPVIDTRAKRPIPHENFKPYQNIILSSQIVWKGERRNIRYYDGCTSIFTDDQPKEPEMINRLIAQTAKRGLEKGKFSCWGDERQLLLYLTICSWNAESEFRTRTADAIFMLVNKDKEAAVEEAKLDKQEEALKLAKEATGTKMLIHANFMGIPTTDWDTGNDLSEKEIRTAYRREALENPVSFINSYGNKSIELKYYIDKALTSGVISNKDNPNKATWSKSQKEICDISGLRSQEAIADKLLEFSQLDDGAEFGIQLKALYN
jgi:hypothetical protein